MASLPRTFNKKKVFTGNNTFKKCINLTRACITPSYLVNAENNQILNMYICTSMCMLGRQAGSQVHFYTIVPTPFNLKQITLFWRGA